MGTLSGSSWLLIALIAVAAGGVLSALFHSLKEMSRARLESIAAIRKSEAATRRVDAILSDPEAHATACALPRVLLNLIAAVASTFAVAAFAQGQLAPDAQTGPGWREAVAGIAMTSVLTWVFGLLIPQSVAKHVPEATVYAWSMLIRGLFAVSAPVRALGNLVDEIVKRLAGRTDADESGEIQQELLDVVQEAREDGQFDEREKSMIEAVVNFRNLTVRQVMTPRTEIASMELTNSLSDVTAYIRTCGHSRIPVHEGSLDSIIGFFYVKDLMRWLAGDASRGGKTFDFRSILRPAMFVPETKTVRETLHEMLAKKVHIAIVADEFGGTAGLITVEDIMEEIVGEIQDEYETTPDAGASPIRLNRESRTAEIDARAYIDDVNVAIEPLGVQLPESAEYETVAGFVAVSLGHIPAKGEAVRLVGGTVRVIDAEPKRAIRVLLTADAPVADDESRGDGSPDDSRIEPVEIRG
jgi:CBS domain containing-hemolysin-like protein